MMFLGRLGDGNLIGNILPLQGVRNHNYSCSDKTHYLYMIQPTWPGV